MLFQPAQHHPTVVFGHHNIQQDHLRIVLIDQREYLVGILGGVNVVTAACGETLHQLEHIGVVIHGQNGKLFQGGETQMGAEAPGFIQDQVQLRPRQPCHLLGYLQVAGTFTLGL